MEKSGALTLEISKRGLSFEEAVAQFPEFIRKRGKYLAVAQSILQEVKDLDTQQIHPCEIKNADPKRALGLVHFVNDHLKENKSGWRLKFSPTAEKYVLYNLELLGKKK